MEKTLTWGSLESPMRNMVASLSGLSSFWLEPHVRLIASRRATWRGSLVTTNKKSTFWSGNCGDKIVEFSAGKMYRLTSRGVSWPQSWRSSTMITFMAQKVMTMTSITNFEMFDRRMLAEFEHIVNIFKKAFSSLSKSGNERWEVDVKMTRFSTTTTTGSR